MLIAYLLRKSLTLLLSVRSLRPGGSCMVNESMLAPAISIAPGQRRPGGITAQACEVACDSLFHPAFGEQVRHQRRIESPKCSAIDLPTATALLEYFPDAKAASAMYRTRTPARMLKKKRMLPSLVARFASFPVCIIGDSAPLICRLVRETHVGFWQMFWFHLLSRCTRLETSGQQGATSHTIVFDCSSDGPDLGQRFRIQSRGAA